MSAIIDQLKKDHVTMLKVADEMAAKPKPSPAEIKTFIATLKSSILAHIKKEDDQLYPRLKTLAETNPALKSKLNLFSDEMTKVSGAALAFIDKYAQGNESEKFAAEYAKFLYTLKTRMRREEESLYTEYKD
jgi:iron-sulfur cluster repair protein YtfE (RIC family)